MKKSVSFIVYSKPECTVVSWTDSTVLCQSFTLPEGEVENIEYD